MSPYVRTILNILMYVCANVRTLLDITNGFTSRESLEKSVETLSLSGSIIRYLCMSEVLTHTNSDTTHAQHTHTHTHTHV